MTLKNKNQTQNFSVNNVNGVIKRTHKYTITDKQVILSAQKNVPRTLFVATRLSGSVWSFKDSLFFLIFFSISAKLRVLTVIHDNKIAEIY